MKRTVFLFQVIAVCVLTSACGRSVHERETASELEGLYSPSAVWPKTNLSVCWTTPGFAEEKGWVQERVTDTWEKHSALSFSNWGDCGTGSADISIGIHDGGAFTYGLGQNLRHSRPGMMLNFTFGDWNASCRTKRQVCIETIAIHEFGHAIGISHEHNRGDREWDCTSQRQGGALDDTQFGQFDPDSIMNYCYQSSYTNTLSAGDIRLAQYLYGAAGGKSDPSGSPSESSTPPALEVKETP